MLTAIIRCLSGPDDLGRTLAPLVRGVVEGLLSEVLIVAVPGDAGTRHVGDACGAMVLEASDWRGGLERAARMARCEQLLLIDSGVVLGEVFWPALADALARDESRPLVTALPGDRLIARLLMAARGHPGPDQAVIVDRSKAEDPWSGRLNPRPATLAAPAFRPVRPPAS